MRLNRFALIATAVLVIAATGPGFPAGSTGRLVWHDEFNGAAGSAPNPAYWTYDVGGGGWGNGESEVYTNSRQNSFLDGHGHLVIRAMKDDVGKVTSARLKTEGLFSHAYGRFEARIKIPAGQGIWPAFWIMGDDINKVGWPACGEVDIMENIGKEPGTIHGTAHGPAGNELKSYAYGIGGPYSLPHDKRFASRYHLFALDWTPQEMTWSVDRRPYFTLRKSDLKPGQKWVFDRPNFILLNVAVGGYWPGPPDASTHFPQEMLVDYVRVYALR